MPIPEKLATELKAMAFAAIYFGAWFGVLALLKSLVLEEDGIDLSGIDSIVISLSLLVFNVFAVIRRHLGTGGLARLLLAPPGDRHDTPT